MLYLGHIDRLMRKPCNNIQRSQKLIDGLAVSIDLSGCRESVEG